MVNGHSPSISRSLSPYSIEWAPQTLSLPNIGAKVSAAYDDAMVKGRINMEV